VGALQQAPTVLAGVAVRVVAGRVVMNGTSATFSETGGSFIEQAAQNQTGHVGVIFKAGTFSGPATCTCSAESYGVGPRLCSLDGAPASGAFYFAMHDPSGAERNAAFNFVCIGPR